MIKYTVILFSNYKIEKIEIEKETEKSYWINGNRNAKRTEYSAAFDTFDEAKEYAVKHIENKYLASKKRTAKLLDDLTEVIKLEE